MGGSSCAERRKSKKPPCDGGVRCRFSVGKKGDSGGAVIAQLAPLAGTVLIASEIGEAASVSGTDRARGRPFGHGVPRSRRGDGRPDPDVPAVRCCGAVVLGAPLGHVGDLPGRGITRQLIWSPRGSGPQLPGGRRLSDRSADRRCPPAPVSAPGKPRGADGIRLPASARAGATARASWHAPSGRARWQTGPGQNTTQRCATQRAHRWQRPGAGEPSGSGGEGGHGVVTVVCQQRNAVHRDGIG